MPLEVITQTPTEPTRPTPLLFVHGAWHAAWCWEPYFLPYFAEQGYTCHAPSLRGHGGSPGHLRSAGISDYVEDVASVAAALPTQPVVIGHSMGGLVVQKYLEQHPAPAGVLLASIPTTGALPFLLRYAALYPGAFLRFVSSLDPYRLVNSVDRVHDLFFSPQLSRAKVARYFERIGSESLRVLPDVGLLALPRPRHVDVPLLVLGGAEDTVFTTGEVERTARAYSTTAHIFPSVAHDMMLDPDWQTIAAHIYRWLDAQGL